MVFCRCLFICLAFFLCYYFRSVTCDDSKLEEWKRDPKFDFKTIKSRNPHDILRPFMNKYKNLDNVLNERYRMKMKHRTELRRQLTDKASIQQLDRYFMNRLPKYSQTKRSYRRKLVGYKPTTKKKGATTKKGGKKGRQGDPTEQPAPEETTAPGDPPAEETTAAGDTTTPSEGATTSEGATAEPAAGDTATTAAGGGADTTLPYGPYSPNVVLPDPIRAYKIKDQMETIKAAFPNVNITVESIGRTVSFNDIILFKAIATENKTAASLRSQSKYMDEKPEKKIVFIVQSLTLLDIKLIDCLSTVQGMQELFGYYFQHLDKYDIFLMPLANPDGYAELPDVLRFYNDSAAAGMDVVWDKNMSFQKGSCVGVNLDRNFDIGWSAATGSGDPCRYDYPGPRAFSEVETQAIREILHKHSQRMGAFIHVHAGSYSALSYKGDAVLYPKGYSEVTSDDDKYIDLRGDIEEALKQAGFKQLTVTVDTIYNWYGSKVIGTSVDYASGVYGIPYSMEFVMQGYAIYVLNKISIREVWSRVINTTFVSMNKVRTTDLFEKK